MTGSGHQQNLLLFFRFLATAMANATLYSLTHAQVERQITEAHRKIEELLAEDNEDISLLLVGDNILFRGQPLPDSLHIDRVSRALRTWKIDHLEFVAGVTKEEIQNLLQALVGQFDANKGIMSTAHVRFGKVEVRYDDKGKAEENLEKLRKIPTLEEISAEEVSRFLEMYEGVRKYRKLNILGISEIVSGFVDAFTDQADPLLALAPLRAMDEYTFTHSTNVCILNLAQAMALGIEGPRLNEIGIAAMLHDVGKLFIPEEIINKAGKLTDEEFDLIKQHPVKGAQYLLETTGVPRLAVVTAFEHHLRYDLKGYPQMPPKWQQNLCSQLTTISDVFDAMRTNRSYRLAMDADKVSAIMLEMAGKELHPVLTRNFLLVLNRLGKDIPG